MEKYCELCQKYYATDMYFGVGLCDECYEGFQKVLQKDSEMVLKYKESYNFPNASEKAKKEIIALAGRMYQKMLDEGKIVEEELKRQEFALSFNEYYEYDVVSILNENHGQIDRNRMQKILSQYSKQGWKLHTIYSNELGKNAVSLLGLGVNATACEDVLIFERRIERFEQDAE